MASETNLFGPVLPSAGLRDLHVRNLFIFPTLLLLICFNVFPLVWSFALSFTEYRATGTKPPVAVGLDNYKKLLNSPEVHGYFAFTARYTVLVVGIEFVLGFGLALLLNREFPGKGLVVTLLLLPMMLSPAIMATLWRYILDPNYGVLSYLLASMPLAVRETFGIPETVHWFSDPTLALAALVIVDVWQWTPFVMLISMAGLGAIPSYLYEAARIDRASKWFQFRHITLPLVAPLLIMALIFRTMDAFKVFDLVVALTDGGPFDQTTSISRHIYRLALTQSQTGLSCALGYVVLVFVIGLSNLYLQYLDRIRGRA